MSSEPFLAQEQSKGTRTYALYLPPEQNDTVIMSQKVGNLLNIAEKLSLSVLQPSPTLSPPYTVSSVESKGFGLVANRVIKAGETVLYDKPIMAWYQKGGMIHAHAIPDEKWYHSVVERLSISSKATYLSLSHTSVLGSHPSAQARNIAYTNAITSYLGGEPYMGVYPIVSRINHSCLPNAVASCDDRQTGLYRIIAIKEIPEGGEITISYLQPFAVYKERQTFLERGTWQFTCTCELCRLSPADRRISDDRIRVVSNFFRFVSQKKPIARTQTHEMIEDALKAAREDELILELPELLVSAANMDWRGRRSPWYKEAVEKIRIMKEWGLGWKYAPYEALLECLGNETEHMTLFRLQVSNLAGLTL